MNINLKVLEKLLDRTGDKDARIGKHMDIVSSDLSLLKKSIVAFSEFLSPLESNKAEVSVWTLAKRSLHLVPARLRQDITMKTEQHSPNLLINKPQVEQALLELLINALEASGRQKKVRVLVRAKGRLIEIQVHDDGNGIPRKEKQKIFHPFYSTKEGRVGLGLARARRFVSVNNGEVVLKRSSAKGSIFSIILESKS